MSITVVINVRRHWRLSLREFISELHKQPAQLVAAVAAMSAAPEGVRRRCLDNRSAARRQ